MVVKDGKYRATAWVTIPVAGGDLKHQVKLDCEVKESPHCYGPSLEGYSWACDWTATFTLTKAQFPYSLSSINFSVFVIIETSNAKPDFDVTKAVINEMRQGVNAVTFLLRGSGKPPIPDKTPFEKKIEAAIAALEGIGIPSTLNCVDQDCFTLRCQPNKE